MRNIRRRIKVIKGTGVIIVTDYKSSNGSKHQHLIYGSTPYADFLRLKEEYRAQDIEAEQPDWLVTVMYHNEYMETIKVLNNGNLICCYCGAENLIIYDWRVSDTDPKKMATVDHFWAKSKFPIDRRNTDNFIIACKPCNGGKKDKVYGLETLKYLNRYPFYDEKIKQLLQFNTVTT